VFSFRVKQQHYAIILTLNFASASSIISDASRFKSAELFIRRA
jgi:hypothetical protein